MTSPVLLSRPSPHRKLPYSATGSNNHVGEGRRTSDVTSPQPDWLAAAKFGTNQRSRKVWRGPAESSVATGRGEQAHLGWRVRPGGSATLGTRRLLQGADLQAPCHPRP